MVPTENARRSAEDTATDSAFDEEAERSLSLLSREGDWDWLWLFPSSLATSEMLVRNSGSLYSLLTAYCAEMATPAPPNTSGPSRPR